MARFIIRSLDETGFDGKAPLYWSNRIGWVNRICATRFSRKEMNSSCCIPMNSIWERFDRKGKGDPRCAKCGRKHELVIDCRAPARAR